MEGWKEGKQQKGGKEDGKEREEGGKEREREIDLLKGTALHNRMIMKVGKSARSSVDHDS